MQQSILTCGIKKDFSVRSLRMSGFSHRRSRKNIPNGGKTQKVRNNNFQGKKNNIL